METVKRYLGICWIILGPLVWLLLITSAIRNINASTKGDISHPLPWVIIIGIFTPIAIGLVIFGWYCWKGEYEFKKQIDSYVS